MNIAPILITVGFSFICAAVQARASVHWHASVEQANEDAIETSRPIWIEFYAEWCAPCKQMEKEVYSSPEFEQASARFLLVRIDVDKENAAARKYNVITLPTIVFADSYGNELFRHAGYLGAQPLLEVAAALPGNVAEFNRWNRILSADRNNFDALIGLGDALREAKLYRASIEYYVRALQRHEGRTNLDKREAILNHLGLNFLTLRDAKHAAAIFEKCLKEFPNSSRKGEWMLHLGEAYSLGDKNDRQKARTLHHGLIPAVPQVGNRPER